MREILELQKKAFIENGQPSYNQRLDSLKRCIALLETHDVQIVEALNEDYKNRSETEIMTSEVIQSNIILKKSIHLKTFNSIMNSIF